MIGAQDPREVLAGAIDFAKQNDDLVHLDLEVAEALAVQLKREPDPEVVAAWANWAKLRAAAQSFRKAVRRRGDGVVRLAGRDEDIDRAVSRAVEAAHELLELLDDMEPPDEVYREVRR